MSRLIASARTSVLMAGHLGAVLMIAKRLLFFFYTEDRYKNDEKSNAPLLRHQSLWHLLQLKLDGLSDLPVLVPVLWGAH